MTASGQVAVTQAWRESGRGGHLGEDREEVFDGEGEAGQVEVAVAGLDLDEKVEVTVGGGGAGSDGAEHAHGVYAAAAWS